MPIDGLKRRNFKWSTSHINFRELGNPFSSWQSALRNTRLRHFLIAEHAVLGTNSELFLKIRSASHRILINHFKFDRTREISAFCDLKNLEFYFYHRAGSGSASCDPLIFLASIWLVKSLIERMSWDINMQPSDIQAPKYNNLREYCQVYGRAKKKKLRSEQSNLRLSCFPERGKN
jgi:hypothetical protein